MNGARSSRATSRGAEPGEPGVDDEVRAVVAACREDLDGDQRGEQRHRDQVGDALDDGVLQHLRAGTERPASLSR